MKDHDADPDENGLQPPTEVFELDQRAHRRPAPGLHRRRESTVPPSSRSEAPNPPAVELETQLTGRRHQSPSRTEASLLPLVPLRLRHHTTRLTPMRSKFAGPFIIDLEPHVFLHDIDRRCCP